MTDLNWTREERYKKTAEELGKRLFIILEEEYRKIEGEYELGVPINRILIEVLKASEFKFKVEYLQKHNLIKEHEVNNG